VNNEPEQRSGSQATDAPLRRLLLGGLLAGGLFAAGLALWQSVSSAGDEVLPPVSRWIVAAVFIVLWLYAAVKAWIALFEAPEQRETLTGALILSQLGKYVPGGGIVQVTAMVAMSRNEQVSTSRLALGLPVVGLSVIAAGGVALAGLAVVGTVLEGWLRALALLGFLAPIVLWRPMMAFSVQMVRRIISRIPPPDDLPSQRAILVSGGWAAASLVASGVAYAFLVQPAYDDTDLLSLTLAFMVAWTVGFIILPVPGGIGIREAVLVWLIGGSVASIVGASIAHRIIAIVVELGAVGIHILARRIRSPGQESTGA
jgi:uncharacterized membrane protein YbhN (UPF0104 family)